MCSNPLISIIILNWNGWEDTIECLESVYQLNYPNYNVIVLDNDSHDDSIQKINEYAKGKINLKSNFFEFDQINKPIKVFDFINSKNKSGKFNSEISDLESKKKLILISNDKNYGFTEGNNIGIRFALKSLNQDYILIINNDTVVNKDLLKKLVSASILDDNIGLTQAKLLYYSYPEIINTTGNMMDKYGAFQSRGWKETDNLQYDKLVNEGFFYASGACTLINVEFILKLGIKEFFDTKFFAYHEDIDISWIARLLGYKIIYCPDAICYHKEGNSIQKSASLLMTYLSFKNNIRMLIKNYSIKNLIWILPSAIAIDAIISILASIRNRKIKYFIFFIKACLWNIIFLPDSIRKRKIIQSKRELKDVDLFNFMESGSIKISQIFKTIQSVFYD